MRIELNVFLVNYINLLLFVLNYIAENIYL
jgi:hypothetical protein